MGPGTYTLTAKAIDNAGESATSPRDDHRDGPPAGNQPPTVSLTQPADGAILTAPAAVHLAATASDTDGSVTKVEFFNGTTKLGEDTTAPYTFDWGAVGRARIR